MCVGRLLVLVALLSSCSQLTTEAPADGEVFDAPVDGLSPEELAAFTRGDGEFGRRFSPSSGLGPVFNNVSCLSCHSGDGRGELRNALQRIGSPGDDFLRSLGGPQIQDKAIPGAVAERLPTGVHVSLRLPPPVFGVGLIEAIPQATILALADPDDQNGDGISGRANLVTPADYTSAGEPGGGTGTARLGRFGRKAQVSNLLEQVTEAYHQDMGITSDFRPNENGNPLSGLPSTGGDLVPDPEVSAATVRSVVQYIRSLAPPGPGTDTPARVEGRRLFTSIGCEACHVTALQSGTSVVAALSNRRVELYSDLLLHDGRGSEVTIDSTAWPTAANGVRLPYGDCDSCDSSSTGRCCCCTMAERAAWRKPSCFMVGRRKERAIALPACRHPRNQRSSVSSNPDERHAQPCRCTA